MGSRMEAGGLEMTPRLGEGCKRLGRHHDLTSSDDAIDETRRIFSGEPVFEQRRDIDQRGRVTNRVVLVFVMRLVRADGVIARPLAIAKTFAEWQCPFVKCGSDGHAYQGSVFVRASDYKYPSALAARQVFGAAIKFRVQALACPRKEQPKG